MPTTERTAPRVPDAKGNLMTQLTGSCAVMQVVPKMFDDKQKMKEVDGKLVPQWTVCLFYTGEDGNGADMVKATYTSEQKPSFLIGKACEDLQLGAMFWQMGTGRNGWAYTLDGGFIDQLMS